ncbi:hypothetical protein BU23DRAFT_631244 [Bimuria novae-zelandiae CBS 107.79]|uniref:Uncharacterized protein n=1 Tax=Bimuria novae-zelandiae CBS 107.79 TaxID=1447943 RepID=A0A6A5VFX1_9PLEO|nr:hypothetical protein BU23DRAFT_631244 [Bimuria novae-zelandiae CBS 107.79]
MSEQHHECLNELISRFQERLALYGCTSGVGPYIGQPLENEVIPMLAIERWATSPDQLDERSYHRLRRALQLTSLFLTEYSTLGWFCHYTFGQRKKNSSGQTYISPTEYARTAEAREKVKRNIRALTSHEHNDCYGMTYSSKRSLPFFHRFWEHDWPETPSDRRRHPVVVMHNDFSKYFSQQDLRNADRDVWLRTQFLFATTLVHEIAHAYSMWLEKDHYEPLWSREDREAELGFSWENETLGYICNPLFHTITGCEMLLSMKAVSYEYNDQQPGIVRKLIGQHPLHFHYRTTAEAASTLVSPLVRIGSGLLRHMP